MSYGVWLPGRSAANIVHFEADSEGRIYAVDNREVIPTGIVLPEFAGRSDITTFEYADALCNLSHDRETISGG